MNTDLTAINIWQLILLVFFLSMFIVNWIQQRGDRRILIGILIIALEIVVLQVQP